MAGLFGKYFSTVVAEGLIEHFQGNISQACTLPARSLSESLFIPPVAADDIQNVIASLPNKQSTGYDNMPTQFIKKFSSTLSPILAHIFNVSILNGVFPDALKTTIVIPVPKKGDLHNITNYRPIALLSVFSKIFEKIMAANINSFLKKIYILSHSQHGFREGHSTETAIVSLVQHINDRLDRSECVVAVSFDLSRAFDTLHPVFFSEKIARLGLRGRVNDWLVSYLESRRFRVRVDGEYSVPFSTDLGTPQGSVLGPLIFLLYVNDLPDYINEGEVFSYADDTTIVVSDSCPDGVCYKVSRIVEDFRYWCDRNRLVINLDKTVYVKFRTRLHRTFPPALNILGNLINFSQSMGFLGCMLDCDLTWELHIAQIAKKLNSAYFAKTSLKSKLD